MSASMLPDLKYIANEMFDRIPVTEYDPCEVLIALEDRDDSEWQALGYKSRASFINAHINGEI